MIPGSGRFSGEGNGNPLQYSCLRNPIDRESGGLQSMGSQRVVHNVATKQGFPGGSDGKASACNAEDLDSIPRLGRSPGEGKGYPLQYCGLENSMDYSPWGRKESDMTEQLSLSLSFKKTAEH